MNGRILWNHQLLHQNKEIEKVDFLKEFQQELKEEFERTGKKPLSYSHNWQKDLTESNLSNTERFDFVKGKAAQLESFANQKKKFLKVKGGSIEEQEEVNDLIFESINAKLSLLQTSVKKEE